MNTLTTRKAIFYLAGIFAAGLLIGAAVGVSWGRRPPLKPPRPEQMLEHIRNRLTADLALTADQVQKIEPILREGVERIQAAHQANAEQVFLISKQTDERIKQFLTPIQAEKLDRLQKDREQHFRQGLKGRGGRKPC
jgi:Spy/CpxP family protein refolding chaperone